MINVIKYAVFYRQMVYPEKPLSKETWRLGGKQSRGKFSGKFRLGSRDAANYWQENLEQWEQDEEYSPESSPRQSREKWSLPSQNGGSGKHTEWRYTESMESSKNNNNTNNDFVHHPGFQGSEPAKLKVGKKASKFPSSKSDSAVTSQSTFRPKGFGSLYDEMEFQRRYKKVFDVNNHIHFVHSNYISGHKISKRTKLPPIGYVPGVHAESQENLDIFAIMSVQKYNHPETDGPNASVTTPGINLSSRKENETENGIHVPPGFIPSPAKSYSKSPFTGIKGSPPHNITPRGTHVYRLPTLSKDESDTHFGQLSGDLEQNSSITDDNIPLSDRSYTSKKSKKSKLSDTSKIKKGKTVKTKAKNDTDNGINDDIDNQQDEMEPFTFSVKVQIKPKDPIYQSEQTNEITEGQYESNRDVANNFNIYQSNNDVAKSIETHYNDQTISSRIMYPSQNYDSDSEISVTGEKVVTPRNIVVTTSEFGIIRKKVQYPESFVIENSLAEVDESKLSDSELVQLNVPSNIDSNESHVKPNERYNSNLSSGHSSVIPEIRTICPTPNPDVNNDDPEQETEN